MLVCGTSVKNSHNTNIFFLDQQNDLLNTITTHIVTRTKGIYVSKYNQSVLTLL